MNADNYARSESTQPEDLKVREAADAVNGAIKLVNSPDTFWKEKCSQTAKVFLDEQVRLLNGIPEVDDDGDTFYRFPKLRLPDLPIDDDWWGEPKWYDQNQ